MPSAYEQETPPGFAAPVVPHYINANGKAVPLPSPVAGGVTWTKTVVALTGASQTLLAANATRKGFFIVNPVGNDQVSYDMVGGAVTLAGGIPILAYDSDGWEGADCPVGNITIIGTNGQSVVVYQGV